ncbi:MAG TPA: hypothetical protein VKZ92_08515 [Pseudohongiella sp.]|nr:hypothetical protein [Pseudohongiella sp.]
MSAIGFVWGVGGILMLLTFAIFRLSGFVMELESFEIPLWQWLVTAGWLAYMVWAEGYKGFHRAFAPRVVVRASYLAANPRPLHVLLAPLFCMGYIYATRKRQIVSIALSCMVICFILAVRMLPQPWRGIIDVGVIAGLAVGVASIVYYLLQLKQAGAASLPVAADVPA